MLLLHGYPTSSFMYRELIPRRAEVPFYDTGHFALETHVREIGGQIHRFLDQHVMPGGAR